jgi:hypothetical protein
MGPVLLGKLTGSATRKILSSTLAPSAEIGQE